MESELKKRIEALRSEAEEQTRSGHPERAAEIRQSELPRLEAELKRLNVLHSRALPEVRDTRPDDGSIHQYAHRCAQGRCLRHGDADLGGDL
jgi:hypothetical protein